MTARRTFLAVLASVALVAAACGGSSNSSSGGGETRTVQVDWKHDAFSSTFLGYYPKNVTVHPGDTVRFHQNWSGEPHSVTLGTYADSAVQLFPLVEKYDSADDARKGGVPEETIQRILRGLNSVPPMTDGPNVYEPGARPCYVDDPAAVPEFGNAETEEVDPNAKCPDPSRPQPKFTGRQGLYNSGFIPFQGAKGNTYTVPISSDAAPGTYRFFCNYHFVFMSGAITVVPKSKPIPSQVAVDRDAQKEVAKAATAAVATVRKADKGQFPDGLKPPIAGLSTGNDEDPVGILQFFPATVNTTVNKPVTWTNSGRHTISFNVPKYFPVFTVAKNGRVERDPKSFEPVGWKVPESGPPGDHGEPAPRQIDVGTWDGSGGFHSSGSLDDKETFTITFSKPGTYLYACVIHPAMVGKVVVKA